MNYCMIDGPSDEAAKDFSIKNRETEGFCPSPKLRAVELGVKPAMYFRDIPNELQKGANFQKWLDAKGLTVLLGSNGSEQMIVNTRAVEARVKDEPDLAKEVGWISEQSTNENLKRLESDSISVMEHALYGFILGFPEIAIVDFKKRGQFEIAIHGLAPNNILNFATDRFPLKEGVIEPLDSVIKPIARDLAKERDRLLDLKSGDMTQEQRAAINTQVFDLLQSHQTDFVDFYERAFHMSRQESENYLLDSKIAITIADKEGNEIMKFVVHSPKERWEKDVEALRQKVLAAL